MKVNNEMSLAQCLALGRALVSGGGSCNYPKMEWAGSAGGGQRESGQLSSLWKTAGGSFVQTSESPSSPVTALAVTISFHYRTLYDKQESLSSF